MSKNPLFSLLKYGSRYGNPPRLARPEWMAGYGTKYEQIDDITVVGLKI